MDYVEVYFKREVNTMKKEEFDALFQECFRELMSRRIETLQPKLEKLAAEDRTLTMEKMVTFAYLESFDTSKELLYSVLSKIVVKD